MDNMKPVAWQNKKQPRQLVAFIHQRPSTQSEAEFRPLYYIPDTHRVVSVELLRVALDSCVMSGYDGAAEELESIIDNKEQS